MTRAFLRDGACIGDPVVSLAWPRRQARRGAAPAPLATLADAGRAPQHPCQLHHARAPCSAHGVSLPALARAPRQSTRWPRVVLCAGRRASSAPTPNPRHAARRLGTRTNHVQHDKPETPEDKQQPGNHALHHVLPVDPALRVRRAPQCSAWASDPAMPIHDQGCVGACRMSNARGYWRARSSRAPHSRRQAPARRREARVRHGDSVEAVGPAPGDSRMALAAHHAGTASAGTHRHEHFRGWFAVLAGCDPLHRWLPHHVCSPAQHSAEPPCHNPHTPAYPPALRPIHTPRTSGVPRASLPQ